MRNIVKRVGAAVIGAVGVVAGTANAALPASISTKLTEVQTDGLALADLVWPVLIALFGSILLMKLFKRFSSKI